MMQEEVLRSSLVGGCYHALVDAMHILVAPNDSHNTFGPCHTPMLGQKAASSFVQCVQETLG